jgi:hypothetical protein
MGRATQNYFRCTATPGLPSKEIKSFLKSVTVMGSDPSLAAERGPFGLRRGNDLLRTTEIKLMSL